jgi:hypothetical protein
MSSAEDFFGGEVDQKTDPRGFELDQSEDTNSVMEEYTGLAMMRAELRGRLKEIDKDIEDCEKRLRIRMNGRQAVRTLSGWTMAWVHKHRVGYTMPAKEWEAFEIRSPF